MKLGKAIVLKYQELVWSKVIVPVADFFKLDCEYCWWWRGVLLGSIVTGLLIGLVA